MKQKNRAATLLKLCVIALCLYLLSRKLDLHEVRQSLVLAHPLYLLPAIAMILLEPVVMALKWDLLLRQKHIHAGLFNLVRLIFTTNFLSPLLFTAVGADAARLALISRQKHSLTHAGASLLAARLLGLGAIALLSLIGLGVIGRDHLPERIDLKLILAACALTLAAIATFMSPLPAHIIRLLEHLFGLSPVEGLPPTPAAASPARRLIQRGIALVTNMHASLRAYLAMPRTLALVFSLNVFVQILRTLQIHCLFRTLGAPVSLSQELVFVPIIILLSLLPISYFGLGIKEGAFVYFFSSLGIPAPLAVSVSILTYPLILIGFLPGAIFLLFPTRTEPRADS